MVIGAVLASFALGAQDQATFEKLSVKVQANKASYIELEPVQLLVSVQNRSGQGIPGVSSPFSASIAVEVARGDGAFGPYNPAWRPACDAPTPASKAFIPAGYSGKERLVVYYKTVDKEHLESRIFPEPDRYRCRVRLSQGEHEALSDVVEFRIVKPFLPVDVAAREYLQAWDLDLFLSSEARNYAVTEQTLVRAEEALKKFPKSTYEPYLCLGIGSVYFGRSTPGGQPGRLFDENGLKRAVQWCEMAAGSPDHPASDDAALVAGKACYYLKQTQKAGRFLDQAEACGCEHHAAECRKLRDAVKVLESSGLKRDE